MSNLKKTNKTRRISQAQVGSSYYGTHAHAHTPLIFRYLSLTRPPLFPLRISSRVLDSGTPSAVSTENLRRSRRYYCTGAVAQSSGLTRLGASTNQGPPSPPPRLVRSLGKVARLVYFRRARARHFVNLPRASAEPPPPPWPLFRNVVCLIFAPPATLFYYRAPAARRFRSSSFFARHGVRLKFARACRPGCFG